MKKTIITITAALMLAAPAAKADKITRPDALEYCHRNSDALESGDPDEHFISIDACADRIMRTEGVSVAGRALMPASTHAASVTKGQACEKIALKATYPIAMRNCNGQATKECKQLMTKWLTAAALQKRHCIDEPRGDLK